MAKDRVAKGAVVLPDRVAKMASRVAVKADRAALLRAVVKAAKGDKAAANVLAVPSSLVSMS